MGEDQSTEARVGRAVIGAASALWLVVSLVVGALFVGLLIPVTRDHCAVTNDGDLNVHSNWSVKWDLFAFNDGAGGPRGDEYCIRNTVTREVLASIGIWPLGSPDEQIEAAVVDYAAGGRDDGTAEYIQAAFDLRSNTDEASAASSDLQNADNPEEARAALVSLRDLSQEANDVLDGLDPPPSLQDFHTHSTELNAEFIDASDAMIDAIDSGDRSEMKIAYADWLDLMATAAPRAEQIQEELDQAVGQ